MSALNIQNLLKETILVGITDHSLQTLAGLSIISLGILVAGFLVYKLVNVIIVSWVNQIFRHSRYIFLNAIADAHLINIISIFIFAIILDVGSALIDARSSSYLIDAYVKLLVNGAYLLYFLAVTTMLGRFLSAVNIIYERQFDQQHEYSIYGYVKMLQFGLWCCAAIIYVSFILNKSPWATLTGIGAVSAFLLLIFKDTFLGLISSIQATANQIVKRGDWVVIPKYNVDGEVIYISISSIKIRNWDNTVTSLPTFALTAEAIHNWQAMVNSKARRIFRAINIDTNSLMDCDLELLTNLAQKYPFIAHGVQTGQIRRNVLNLALYRLYMNDFLKNNLLLNHDYSNLVRYLAPTAFGIPLQIYAYSKEVFLEEFEETQSQIIEHILQTLSDFGLKIYQSATQLPSYNNL